MEKGQVPPLTPSRILAPPSMPPRQQVRLTQSPTTQNSPPEASPPGHVPCLGKMLTAGQGGAGAGKSSSPASGCNQCLQSWPRSCPASSQASRFPQDPEPIASCARALHVRSGELHPWSSNWLCPRRGVWPRQRIQTPCVRDITWCRHRDMLLPLPQGLSGSSGALAELWLHISSLLPWPALLLT